MVILLLMKIFQKSFKNFAENRFTSCVDHLCFLCFLFLMLSCLFIAALWSPAEKILTSWLLLMMFIDSFYFPMRYPGSGVVFDCNVS